MCDHCHLDEVEWTNVGVCLLQSLKGLYDDFCTGTLTSRSFTKEDRIYYIIFLIILLLCMKLLLRRNKYEEANQPPWEMYGGWDP